MTAEDHTFITDDNNDDLLWDILARLLNHRVKVVRQAAAGALAQAKMLSEGRIVQDEQQCIF